MYYKDSTCRTPVEEVSTELIFMEPQSAFRKLPLCDYCLFYTGNTYLPCSVHPRGVQEDHCLDFREDDTAAKCWAQFLGLSWVCQEGEDYHQEQPGN